MIKVLKTNMQVLLLGLIILSGCKEIPPFIDFTEKVDGLKDTTYIGTAPTAVLKAIYIEDLTGVRCNNCPKAADKIKEIHTANPGVPFVAMGVYPYALSNLTAPYPGEDTLNTGVADDIFNNVYNSPSAIPTGGVNRKLFAGETSLNISYNKWSGNADVVKVEESPIVLTAQLVSYDDVTRKARILTKITFSKKYDASLNLSLYLTESKIISKQTMPNGSLNDTYEHNHALRKAITPYNGTPLKINTSTVGLYEAGRVFEKEFEVSIDSKWFKDNCSIVILVNRFDASSKEVMQATEVELK